MQSIDNNLILGRYQTIETAGVGGCGQVVHAYDTRLKREVAIKVIEIGDAVPVGGGVDEDVIPGLSEARAAGKLANANIVTIYDCEVEDDKAYVIEEYVEGITLTRLLSSFEEYVDLDVIAHVFKSVSSAIMAAHKENILHLDIKPDNILIGRGGDVKVADFGLATLMDLNGEGAASAGTVGYMPMEQMSLEPLDVRSDEWSLAIIAYEMLTSSNPFVCAKSVDDAKGLMMSAELVVPSAKWDELDEDVDDVLFKALSVDREERYASVRQFYSALKPMLGDPRTGKKALSVLINGNDDRFLDTSTITNFVSTPEKKKADYFIDRLGFRGTKICSRILSVASVALVMVFVLANFRTSTTQINGLFDVQMGVCVGTILASSLFALFIPRYAILIPNVALVAMLGFDGAWMPALFHGLTFAVWWVFQGRISGNASSSHLFSVLFSAFGLAPVAIVLTGAVNSFKETLKLTPAILCQLITMSVLGSKNLFTWDFVANFALPAQDIIAAQKLNDNFVTVITSTTTWITVAFFLGAAILFSLICRHGSKVLDVIGAILCSALLFASAVVPVVTQAMQIEPWQVASVALASGIAVFLAAIGFTNRIRLEPSEW